MCPLRSYPVAHRDVVPESIHVTDRYANNHAEQSHEGTRVRERGMRRFKSVTQAQRFVTAHAYAQNFRFSGKNLDGSASPVNKISGSLYSQ